MSLAFTKNYLKKCLGIQTPLAVLEKKTDDVLTGIVWESRVSDAAVAELTALRKEFDRIYDKYDDVWLSEEIPFWLQLFLDVYFDKWLEYRDIKRRCQEESEILTKAELARWEELQKKDIDKSFLEDCVCSLDSYRRELSENPRKARKIKRCFFDDRTLILPIIALRNVPLIFNKKIRGKEDYEYFVKFEEDVFECRKQQHDNREGTENRCNNSWHLTPKKRGVFEIVTVKSYSDVKNRRHIHPVIVI